MPATTRRYGAGLSVILVLLLTISLARERRPMPQRPPAAIRQLAAGLAAVANDVDLC